MRWLGMALLLLLAGCTSHKSTVSVKITKDWITPETTWENTRAEAVITVEL